VSTTANIGYNATALESINSEANRSIDRTSGGGLQDAFDPFGFLLQNQAIQAIPTTPLPAP